MPAPVVEVPAPQLRSAVERQKRSHRWRACHPWLLRTAGCALHSKADGIENLKNIETRRAHRRGKRLSAGAVPIGAVLRHVAGLRSIGDERALGRLQNAAGKLPQLVRLKIKKLPAGGGE